MKQSVVATTISNKLTTDPCLIHGTRLDHGAVSGCGVDAMAQLELLHSFHKSLHKLIMYRLLKCECVFEGVRVQYPNLVAVSLVRTTRPGVGSMPAQKETQIGHTCTNTRLVQMQVCPALRLEEVAAPAAAALISVVLGQDNAANNAIILDKSNPALQAYQRRGK